MNNILTNPIVIALFVFVVTYVYLMWSAKPEIKRTKSGRKKKVKSKPGFTIPLVAGTIAWMIVYCYQQFYVTGKNPFSSSSVVEGESGSSGTDNGVVGGGGGDGSMNDPNITGSMGGGSVKVLENGSNMTTNIDPVVGANGVTDGPDVSNLIGSMQGGSAGTGIPDLSKGLSDDPLPFKMVKSGINIPDEISEDNLPDIFLNTVE